MTAELDEILHQRAWGTTRAIARRLVEDQDLRLQLAEELRHRSDLHGKPLGELLPGLTYAAEPQPPFRELSVRLFNVLMRSHVSSWTRLATQTVTDIGELPNCGSKSVTEILALAILGWAELSWLTGPNGEVADLSPANEDLADRVDSAEPEPRAALPASPIPAPMLDLIVQAEDALGHMWAETGAETLGEAIDDLAAGRAPSLVRAASDLSRLRLDRLLELPTVDESSWENLLAMTYRERRIMEQRTHCPRAARATLDELGGRFNVTRERVRQLERNVHQTLEARIASYEGLGFRHLAQRVLREMGDVADPSAVDQCLTRAVAATSNDGCGELELRKAVLRDLMGQLSEIGGLLWSVAGAECMHELERLYSGAVSGELVDDRRLDAIMNELEVSPEIRARILAHLGLRVCNERLVVWRGPMVDLAVSCLAAHGRPMSLDEIHGEVGYDRNPRSLAGQVQTDQRIIRLGKDSYGLREWGGEEYTGILDAIERAIVEAGGAVDVGGLVARLAGQFGVSENSVRSYTTDRRFIRRGDGTLAMRTVEDPERPIGGRQIELTRGAFRLDGIWHYRLAVDPEMLRGSGRPIPHSIALEAGLEPDMTLGFDYDGGTVVIHWSGPQPTLGSIRVVLSAHSCVEGDLLFIPLDGPEPRPVQVVRSAVRNAAVSIARLAVEMGLKPAAVRDDDPLPVAVALGLPAGADWDDIAYRFSARGEAELIPSIPTEWR